MKKMHLTYFLIVIAIFTVVISGCGKKQDIVNNPPLVKTETISLGDAQEGLSYTGEVRGRYESQLAFQVGGKIIARNVELGSRVQAGDVLMEIDAKDIQQNVNISAAQVDSAKAQLSLAEANLNRFRKLYEEAAVSAAQYEQYQTSYDAALAAYKQAQAQHMQGNNSMGYTQLIADSDGVIAAVNAEAGQVVAAGQSVITLVKAGELEVEINIPENRIKDIVQGQSTNVEFWALNRVNVQGVVREISPIADKVSRTYKARITLVNAPQEIQLGMTASVKCKNKGGESSAAVIPLAAIYQTDDQPKVWVVKDNIVQLQNVSIENFGDNKVKVSSGLQNGDIVVVAGVHKLREGQEVRLQSGEAQ